MLEKKPEQDELEVSVFGPGYGECVVVHLCNNEWIIVDSCRDGSSGRPAAIEYLRRLNLDPAEVVRLIVASHWHDDHVRGLAETLSSCTSAQFVVANALRSKEFLKLVHGMTSGNRNTGVDEFAAIVEELRRRKAARAIRTSPIQFAAQNSCLWRDSMDFAGVACMREVVTLSPSPSATARSFARVARLLPKDLQPLGRLPALEPNHTSVVLWICVGQRAVLLGADLEEVTDKTDGWSGILASWGRPAGRASFFKVPHHGSATGHNADVWAGLLTEKPVAALTPFSNGRVWLPAGQDVERICSYTENAYQAGTVEARRVDGPNREATRILRRMGKELHRMVRRSGHVRVKGDALVASGEWSVETYGAATKIC